MAYIIELMSLGEDLYPILEASTARLNAVQAEFQFRLLPIEQRHEGLLFTRQKYFTEEIWKFLRDQKQKFGGNRPYIIAFVNAPLRSPAADNIFGSHKGEEGLATATIHEFSKYVKEDKRYCCYYLVRYSLSFVNPLIKAHEDPKRSACYFHFKRLKKEIRLSMDSGMICDACQEKLGHPEPNSAAKHLSISEKAALKEMRDVVSGSYKSAIIMKGGGVKGLAFASALVELKQYFYFDRHVGTSAGAIAAVLLAGGYSAEELVDTLRKKDFRQFMDAPLWKVPFNLLLKLGCYPGDHFETWIRECLEEKILKQSEIEMADLNTAVIYACREGPGAIVFDSMIRRKETGAAFATRCSMSIPVFFMPKMIENRRVFDGGIRNNFPLARFLVDYPKKPFIALYLGTRDTGRKHWFPKELLNIVVDGEERSIVDTHRDNVVVIDTTPVGTTDFNMSEEEKDFLLKVGKAAALEFLDRRKIDDGPDPQVVKEARIQAEAARQEAERARSLRKRLTWRRRRIFLLFFCLFLGVLIVAWRLIR